MDLGRVSLGLMHRFKTVSGKTFFGQIRQPQISSFGGSNFDPSTRYLRTTPDSPVVVGDVLITTLNRYFVIAQFDDDDHDSLQLRMYRLFEVPDLVNWKRPTTTTDTVTGLAKSSGFTDLGQMRCQLANPQSKSDGGAGVAQKAYRLVTSAIIQLGDVINNQYRVRQLDTRLGIQFAEIE